MTRALFVIPGDLATISGGYEYDRQVIAHAPEFGAALDVVSLPGGWPHPSADDLAQTRARLAATPRDATLLIDGLALGAMPPDLVRALDRRIVALVHHPLGLEAGLSPERACQLIDNERDVLALVDRIVVTSPHTATLLARDFAVAPARIAVAEPGTEPAPRARGSQGAPRLVAVGSILPRKGYLDLAAALETLRDLDWSLDIAGSLAPSPETVARLRAALDAARLSDRVTLHGAVGKDALETLYARADLFVMPSLYEGYGMALAEAMARGLAIVATRAGAAADTAPDDAALKVEPGDSVALAQALRRALSDGQLRARLAEASWRAGQQLPRWRDTARRIVETIRS